MRFILISDQVRQNAVRAVMSAPAEHVVTIAPRTRSLDQNAKFHAICDDIARSGLFWAGEPRDGDDWKAILISGHAVATGGKGKVIPGIENEFVSIRESSARMSVARAASLIEYTLAFCATHGVELTETMRHGFLDQTRAA